MSDLQYKYACFIATTTVIFTFFLNLTFFHAIPYPTRSEWLSLLPEDLTLIKQALFSNIIEQALLLFSNGLIVALAKHLKPTKNAINNFYFPM
jgi:hypothetical protein